MRQDALGFLSVTRSAEVCGLTSVLDGSRPVLHARFRNGDLLAGISLLSGDFYPAVRYDALEALIIDALASYGDRLLPELLTVLSDCSSEPSTRKGGLTLAGYAAHPNLLPGIEIAWGCEPHPHTLVPALWAALRCSAVGSYGVVDRMLSALAALSAEGELDDRSEAVGKLRHASRLGL